MTDEQINAAIAEACGWHKEDGVWLWTANGINWTSPELRDYCTDLNAMNEAEESLTPIDRDHYIDTLGDMFDNGWAFALATARQRAEAFLRTLGRWEEAE